MELNVTKDNLPFCRALLKGAVGFCKALNAEIDLVKKQGATSPEGVKTKSGKKAAKKATAVKKEEPKEEKTEEKKVAKKAAKKVSAKKAASKKVAKKAASKKVAKKATAEGGGRVTLKMRVQAYLSANKTSADIWTPKELLKSDELDGTGNVPLNQVLNQLIEAKEIARISRGQYKLV